MKMIRIQGKRALQKKNYGIQFAHECIEILASSIALITPLILLLLWGYQLGICQLYGLPFFPSSLSVIRFMPVIVIIAGVIVLWDLWQTVMLTTLFSVKVDYQPKTIEKNEKKQKTYKRYFLHFIWVIIRLMLLLFSNLALLKEAEAIIEGNYPFFCKSDILAETNLVIILGVCAIIIPIILLYEMITQFKEWNQFIDNLEIYIIRKIKKLTFHVSIPTSFYKAKSIIHILILIIFAELIILPRCFAILLFNYRVRYSLVNFDNAQYAIVLDTDDFYIGEPIEIIQMENYKQLIIYTDEYIHLDKAENPLVVQTASFDLVTIMHK